MSNKIFLLFSLLFLSRDLFGQTGGPGQPEFMQFQQAGTSNLVSPSTGTFSYQIPLFTIGGYPMNLSYQSGIQMEDVSSMVGLGWNLNAGSVVRTLRCLPDDFDGDIITKEFSVKDNSTYGGKLNVDLEIGGLPSFLGISVGAGLGVFYNNYKGWGLEPSLNGSISMSAKANQGVGGSASLGMGISVNSQSGVDRYMCPSVGLKLGSGNDKLGISLGKTWSVNSNEGLKTSVNAGLSYVRCSDLHMVKGIPTSVMRNDASGCDNPVTDQASMSLLGYSTSSYLNNCFQPDIDYPFQNISGTYSGTLGLDGFYVDPSIRLTGYFSIQSLAAKSQDFSAYGAMYEQPSIGGKSLMDFNEEKKLPFFIGSSQILPVPFKAPDVFNLNAQGLSMTFSVCRNDIGVVGNAVTNISSNGTQAGAEVNLGELFKAGANVGTNTSDQQSGKWNPTNLDFLPGQDTMKGQLYQQYVLKNHGEINKFNNSLFAQLGGYSPVQFDLANETTISNRLSNGVNVLANKVDSNQIVRQSTINYLNASEAKVIGFDKKINYFRFNTIPMYSTRDSGFRRGNHLSEISVTQPDGMRYVFGLPVYNIEQREVSFNVGAGAGVNFARNLVKYSPGQDNSEGNGKGIDHFFESTRTPAYATQFLITAVLSPDYRDLTNDGISDDDLGNYVKFTYYKEDSNYNWRTPFAEDSATYNRGLRSNRDDDKGTYVFGTKELYYIKSMDSKTETAEFYYSGRNDGYGVTNENGGRNLVESLRKLDSVVIYSLPDRRKNGGLAIPIKTVHFSYDYSLCKGIDNGNSSPGKLTLKKVDFTYEHSRKGKLTPYVFSYGVKTPFDIVNPNYDGRGSNRWGYYQENIAGSYSDCDNNAPLSNIDYPYSSQNKAVMDRNAYAWNLTDITIPGDGKLKVNYEAHDYAYIQDKTAGQMFKITGFNSNGNASLFFKLPLFPANNYNSVLFRLTEPINTGDPAMDKKLLEQDYIKDIKDGYLYYKCLVNMSGVPANYEYIQGYARIDDYGVMPGGLEGYVRLVPADLDDDKSNGPCNPIVKSACQYMRINEPNLLYQNTTAGAPGDFLSFINSLPSIFDQLGNQISATAMGVNLYCQTQDFCKTVMLDHSFIRLYNPVKKKISGGSRVKQISIDDNWNTMTGNTHEGKAYTTTYDYTTEETDLLRKKKDTISSGVADYEPLVGGDEISLKQPIFYVDDKTKAPDNDYYLEEPINESLFPAPHITYGKVTQVTNPTVFNVGKTGKIINEFYTAKDCPVKVGRTGVQVIRDKTEFRPIQPPFVAIDQEHDFAAVSQGYSIELNNMSGLPKATWVYNENGDRISGEVSEYYPDNDHFTTIDNHGFIHRNQRLGVSAEYTVEGKENKDNSVTCSFNANLNISVFGLVAIPLIMPLYSKMTDKKQFHSIVLNKVFHINKLLKSKTVYEQSSCVTTENLAFDEITGEALLTKLANEFNDSLYSFRYPAWWMYDGMSPSYINTKLLLSDVPKYKRFLKVGDEFRSLSAGTRLWVKQNGSTPVFEDDFGAILSSIPSPDYQLYSSGAKNLLSPSAGQVVTWNLNPLNHGPQVAFSHSLHSRPLNTLNSSAIEYYDTAVAYCDSCYTIVSRLGKNDFLSGKLGNYKPKRTWFYLTDRTPANIVNGTTNIKVQGLFKQYNNFWTTPADQISPWGIDYYNWEWKEKVNLTDVDGQTIETEDRIGRKATNLLGYKNTLVTAQANNAAYGDVYFDGFEDYYCAFCPYEIPKQGQVGDPYDNKLIRRVTVTGGNFRITDAESHTGKYSLKVDNSPFIFSVLPPNECGTDSDKPNGVATGGSGNCNGVPSPITGNTTMMGPGTTTLSDVTTGGVWSSCNTSVAVVGQSSGIVTGISDGYTCITYSVGGCYTMSCIKVGTVSVLSCGCCRPAAPVCNDCVGGFFPTKDKKYVFSCWVKVNNPQPIISNSDASVAISVPGMPTITLNPEGPVVEDWQRVSGTFTLPSNNNSVVFRLNKGNAATFYDDIRIFPADGNMVSYVYDDVSLRLTYSLDENNYFTKNEYNNQGELIRIKKETERGIVTIKEGNSSLTKQ